MKRYLLSVVMGCSLVLGSMSMMGCNMFRGMAEDTRETFDAFDAGPHQAYHHDARDF